jgi:phospholipid transport system substrate-binding protein
MRNDTSNGWKEAKLYWSKWGLGMVLIAAGPVVSTAGETPLELIRRSNQAVLEMVGENADLDLQTESRVFAIMDEVTSFDTIADNAVDQHCGAISDELCREFKSTFVKLLQVSSVKRLGRYRADRFVYLDERVEGDRAVVETEAYYGVERVKLDYYLRRVKGRWWIVDYAVEGAGTVKNYRQQFRRLLRKENVEDVIGRLRRRIEEYEHTN